MNFYGFDFAGGYAAFLEYMRAGGMIMWVIFAISIIALAVIIERVIFFAASSANARRLEEAFTEALLESDAAPAQKNPAYRGSLGRLFVEAAANWDVREDELKELLESCVRREIYEWQSNLSFLEIAAKVSPLLGLLGTVLGMVEMFHTLNAGGTVDAAAVTGGIWKALFTTVAGLMVAIPVIIIHGLLALRIDREEEKLLRGIDFITRERASGK